MYNELQDETVMKKCEAEEKRKKRESCSNDKHFLPLSNQRLKFGEDRKCSCHLTLEIQWLKVSCDHGVDEAKYRGHHLDPGRKGLPH